MNQSKKSFFIVAAITFLFFLLTVSQQRAICADESIKVQVMEISVQKEFYESNYLKPPGSDSRGWGDEL